MNRAVKFSPFPAIFLALFLVLEPACPQAVHAAGEAQGVIVSVENHIPGDCAIVATEAYHRVAAAASWARLLHLEYEDGAHMVCAWQVRPNDPILVYDMFFLRGATLELPTAQRDAEVIAKLFADELNCGNWSRLRGGIKITGAHFIE